MLEVWFEIIYWFLFLYISIYLFFSLLFNEILDNRKKKKMIEKRNIAVWKEIHKNIERM